MCTYGEYLRKKRKEKNYSQRKLAMLSGISNTTISRMENGETDSPEIPSLEAIEKALGLDENELVYLAYPSAKRSESSTVLVSGDKLPSELRGIGVKYLRLAKHMEDKEIPPEDIEKIIEVLAKQREK